MKSYRSLIYANEVLKGLITDEALKECQYHSFYSGGMTPGGFCGYSIYGKCAQRNIKVTFYGTNKDKSAPIHIFISIDGKNRIRDEQCSVEDAIKFIINKVNKYL